MIAYSCLGTNDMDRAANFYDGLLGEIGAGRVIDTERYIAWATGEGQPMFCMIKPFDEKPATVGNGVMIAIGAENPATVDRLHAKALELGGTDDGAPGIRADPRSGLNVYYIGYFRDLDGNKLNFYYQSADLDSELNSGR